MASRALGGTPARYGVLLGTLRAMLWYGVPLQRTGAALAGAAAVVETLRDRGVGGGDVEDGDAAEGCGAAQSGDADADFAELASGGASLWGALRCGAAEARHPPVPANKS